MPKGYVRRLSNKKAPKPIEFQSPFIGVNEVAKLYRLSPMTIYRWARLKDLPKVMVGGKIKFHKEILARYFEKSDMTGTH